MKNFWFFCFMLMTYSSLIGQGGVNLNAGLVIAEINDVRFNPEGTKLYGYKIGADIRLNEGSMYFNPGLHYMRISVEPSANVDFFGHSGDFDIIKGRFGFGFKILKLSTRSTLRAKGLAAINYITKTPEKFKELYPGVKINEAFAGIDLGLGLDFRGWTLDMEYEYGLVNMVNEVDDSSMNMYRFSLGIFF